MANIGDGNIVNSSVDADVRFRLRGLFCGAGLRERVLDHCVYDPTVQRSDEPFVEFPAANAVQTLSDPQPGAGFYYLVRRGGSCEAASWQTEVGAEPGRDAALP